MRPGLVPKLPQLLLLHTHIFSSSSSRNSSAPRSFDHHHFPLHRALPRPQPASGLGSPPLIPKLLLPVHWPPQNPSPRHPHRPSPSHRLPLPFLQFPRQWKVHQLRHLHLHPPQAHPVQARLVGVKFSFPAVSPSFSTSQGLGKPLTLPKAYRYPRQRATGLHQLRHLHPGLLSHQQRRRMGGPLSLWLRRPRATLGLSLPGRSRFAHTTRGAVHHGVLAGLPRIATV
jgi:hypothetical protein